MTKISKNTLPSHNRRTLPKGKKTRVFKENLWGATKAPFVKRETNPGQHGGRRKKLTDYGVQLREKQKMKAYYGGLTERQFHKVYVEAARRKGDTSENLIGLLESRLDSVIYRLNLAPTIFAARQMVNHKHVMVNGKVVNIASFVCQPNDVVELREKSRAIPQILGSVQKMERQVPEYLSFNPAEFKGNLIRLPVLDDVPYPVQMNPNLVVEFYNR
jgi:small subunit ribosomal protein S4